MKTLTYPKESVQEIVCPKCQGKEVEHGGYRVRKLRTLEGIQEPRVLKLRCRSCKKHLRSVYPEDTPRASWYSQKVHAMMAVLSTHHVTQGCREEIAEILEYPLTSKTQNTWQEARARRIEQQERQKATHQESPEVVSIDECKLGGSWAYTVTDTATDYVCASALSERRNLFVVRDLVAVVEPKAVISDGCKSIEAGLHWFPKIPHGRCWFHVLQDVCRKVAKEERPKLVADLQVLYENETLPAAERWLRHLMDRYDTTVLAPLLNAWQGLKWWWRVPEMPLTNNTSEHLYGNLWPRARKRDKRTDTRKKAWLKEALWRHNHKPIGEGTSPFEAFFNLPASATKLSWLHKILPRPHTTFT